MEWLLGKGAGNPGGGGGGGGGLNETASLLSPTRVILIDRMHGIGFDGCHLR